MPQLQRATRKATQEVLDVRPDHEFDSNVLRFRRGVGQILGSGIHVHLAAVKLRPSRLAELAVGRPKMRPLRWSGLDEPQRKALEDLLPYRGVDDLVMYGDACVVICPEEEWQAELRRKGRVAQDQLDQDLSPTAVERATGMPIDTRWEDLGEGHSPRTG